MPLLGPLTHGDWVQVVTVRPRQDHKEKNALLRGKNTRLRQYQCLPLRHLFRKTLTVVKVLNSQNIL